MDPHFGYLEAIVLRKTNYNFVRNVHVDRLRPQCISLVILYNYIIMHGAKNPKFRNQTLLFIKYKITTVLNLFKYEVIRYNVDDL